MPPECHAWSIVGTDGSRTLFLDQFLRQELHSMDWAGMACNLRSALSNPVDCPPSADHFCIPRIIEYIIYLGDGMFSAMGVPCVLPPQRGFTWRSWWVFYTHHINFIERLPNRERMLDWLDEAHLQALAALRLMSSTLKALVTCTDPAQHQLGPLLAIDCQPATVLRQKQESTDRLLRSGVLDEHLEDEYDGTVLGSSNWPRRSERHGERAAANAAVRPAATPPCQPSEQTSRERKRPRWPPSDRRQRPINHGNLKAIRKAHPPIGGRGPCYFHFQPGEHCPNGASCKFHHGV